MDDNFFNGILGADLKVCGYKLTNLSLWHLAILEGIQSPILTGEQAEIRDMLIFLKTTQVIYPQTPIFKPTIKDAFYTFRMQRKPKTASKEVLKLKKWLEVQMSCPVLYKNLRKNKSKGHSSPAILSIVCSIVSRAGVNFAEAWNMRSAEARWYEVSLAEHQGADLNISYDNEEIKELLSDSQKKELAKKWLSDEELKSWNGV